MGDNGKPLRDRVTGHGEDRVTTKSPKGQDMTPEALEAAGKIPTRGAPDPGIGPDEDEGVFAAVWDQIDAEA